jgi:uncharacterized membrane protein YhaH (DUF805 family)
MTFWEAVKSCLGKYATFSGRASRSEYWKFILFLLLASILLSGVDSALFGGQITKTENGISMQSDGPLNGLFGLAMVLPLLAAGWRRMHDSGRSGIYLFYPVIATVGVSAFFGFLSGDIGQSIGSFGAIIATAAMIVLTVSPLVVVVWLTRPTQDGPNQYGPPPLAR